MIVNALEALLVGFAAFYLWMLASQLHTPVIRPIQKWLRRGWRVDLVGCPWCSGFWLSLVMVVLIDWNLARLDWITTPVTVLAAAAVCGFFGGFTSGIDLEDGE